MHMARRGRRALLGAFVSALMGLTMAAPASARATTVESLSRPAPSGTASLWSGSSFLQIKSDGTLWTWTWNGTAYSPSLVMSGWGNTTHIAGLQENDFLEIKGGDLREWVYYADRGWGYYPLESGWNNTRLLTGQSGEHFMQIRTDGTLWTWSYVDPGDGNWYYSPKFEMGGWDQTKLIAGLVDRHFLEIKGEELVDWTDPGDGTGYHRTHLDWGWSNVRLIAGVSATRFVTVRTDGTLWDYQYNGTAWTGKQVDGGWDNARLLG